MIDKDLEALILRDSGYRLDRLESDIWRREATFRAARKAMRRLASWQALIMVTASISSAAMGMSLASTISPQPRLADTARLTPSTLLFGKPR